MSGKSEDKGAPGSCSVEAIVSVDERGQMVLPKDFRIRSGIKPGEKFEFSFLIHEIIVLPIKLSWLKQYR